MAKEHAVRLRNRRCAQGTRGQWQTGSDRAFLEWRGPSEAGAIGPGERLTATDRPRGAGVEGGAAVAGEVIAAS